MQQRALIIGWMATIMAVDSASQDENLILAAACGWWGSIGALACLLHDQFYVAMGFVRAFWKGSSSRAGVLVRCDLTGMHDISGLSKNTVSQIFAWNVTRGREWQQCFTWCSIEIIFCSAADRIHAAFGLLAKQDPAGLLLSSFLAREHPLHFWREREYFPHLFWDDVLRESFLTMMFTWVDCKLMMNTCKIGAKWSS